MDNIYIPNSLYPNRQENLKKDIDRLFSTLEQTLVEKNNVLIFFKQINELDIIIMQVFVIKLKQVDYILRI